MPKGKNIKCKHYPDCNFKAPHASLMKHHYKDECEFEDGEREDWIPHGVIVQTAEDAVLVAKQAASHANKIANELDTLFKDVAIIEAADAARKAADAAEEIARKVSMCGRVTLKSLKFFSYNDDKNKYRDIYRTITKKREVKCPAFKDIWDNNDYYTDNYKENRLDSIMEDKHFTFTYKSCNCQEHFTVNSRYDANKLNERYTKIRQCKDTAIKHYYKYCEQTAKAFKTKNLDNPLYQRYAEKYERTWPECRYCQAEFTSKQNYENHEWKCKYNPRNLMEIPIFEEVDNGEMLTYNFFKPVNVFVNKKDIKKLVNSFKKEIIAYSLDFNNKPLARYRIHQVNKSRKPTDFNSDNPKYPFKHLYAYREDTELYTDIFDWDM